MRVAGHLPLVIDRTGLRFIVAHPRRERTGLLGAAADRSIQRPTVLEEPPAGPFFCTRTATIELRHERAAHQSFRFRVLGKARAAVEGERRERIELVRVDRDLDRAGDGIPVFSRLAPQETVRTPGRHGRPLADRGRTGCRGLPRADGRRLIKEL